MISGSLSRHFTLLSVLATLMVVYIHAPTGKFVEESSGWVFSLQSYFSHHLWHVSLPLFFSMSAYFLSVSLGRGRGLTTLLKGRVRSLLVPYLICSAVWLLVIWLYSSTMGGAVGKHGEAFSSAPTVLYHLLVDPLAGQLWFLRDLIVLVTLSFLWKRLPSAVLWVLFLASYLVWLIAPTPTVISMREGWQCVMSTEGLTWFLLGFLAGRHWEPEVLSEKLRSVGSARVLVLGLLYLGIPVLYFMQKDWAWSWVHGVSISCGYVMLLGLLPNCERVANSSFLKQVSAYSFLVYLFHYPILGIVEKLLVVRWGSDLGHLCVYLFVPLLVVAGVLCGAKVMERLTPRLLGVVNGSRSSK